MFSRRQIDASQYRAAVTYRKLLETSDSATAMRLLDIERALVF
jgi:hypothetical protein